MTSINTNIAAQQALRTLQSTNAQLDATQTRISTGLKIGEAKDNAAYWSISTTLKSDNKALGTVKDALGLGAATVDTAYQGLNAAKDVLDEIKTKLTAATQDGVDREVIQAEIDQLISQLKSVASSSTFSGENWLLNAGTTEGGETTFAARNVISSFTRGADGSVTLGSIEIDISDIVLFTDVDAEESGGLLGEVAQIDIRATGGSEGTPGTPDTEDEDGNPVAGTPGTPATPGEPQSLDDMKAFIATVNTAINSVTKAAADLGAVASRIDLQQSFVSNLMDTIDNGVSGLVDADMNEESTRLQALQVKQQLGVQALSIANQSAQNVLRLFQ
ncbi:flagellin [Aureimonas mangrovi]|uniref:flagellin N-terminal helical domain-containing protein n=1 Tax=Aureimonas mangrovi TaxID=2758041 RepID=UPI00163DB8FF|nr:flagellin [Aureimonas mangrovi]